MPAQPGMPPLSSTQLQIDTALQEFQLVDLSRRFLVHDSFWALPEQFLGNKVRGRVAALDGEGPGTPRMPVRTCLGSPPSEACGQQGRLSSGERCGHAPAQPPAGNGSFLQGGVSPLSGWEEC